MFKNNSFLIQQKKFWLIIFFEEIRENPLRWGVVQGCGGEGGGGETGDNDNLLSVCQEQKQQWQPQMPSYRCQILMLTPGESI